MNFKQIFSLTIFCLFISHQCFPQELFRNGFIVKTTGDSIHGYVKAEGKLSAPSACYFKSDLNSTPQRFTASDLTAFGMNEYRYYKAISINNEIRFGQILVFGSVSLYSVGKQFFVERDNKLYELILETVKAEGLALHKKKTYIGTLRAVLTGCQSISASIDHVSLTEPSLTTLLKRYNGCLKADYKVYKDDIPAYKLNVGPVVGISYTRFFFGLNSYSYTFQYINPRPTVGVVFQISSARFLENLSFALEARYTSYSFDDATIFEGRTYDYNRVTLRQRYLYIPVALKYDRHLNRQASVFVKAGLLYTFNLKNDFQIIQKQANYPAVPTQVVADFDHNKSQVGLTAGLGTSFNYKKQKVSCEIRVENIGPLINSASVAWIPNVYSVLFGFHL